MRFSVRPSGYGTFLPCPAPGASGGPAGCNRPQTSHKSGQGRCPGLS